jgi:hydrogenase nickel incorporation protein HypA/HybF
MHERSLVRALLRQVETLAAQHRSSRVIGIRVRIGEFSGVEPELLESAYDDLVEQTSLRGAELAIDRVPLEAICQQCGKRFQIADYRFECAGCGSVQLTISGGEELLLESVTMEEDGHEESSTCGDAAGNTLPARHLARAFGTTG